jgi:hypothetical protein
MLTLIKEFELLHSEYQPSTLITLMFWYRDTSHDDFPDLALLLSGEDKKSENLYRMFFLSFAKMYEEFHGIELDLDEAARLFLARFNELSSQVTHDCVYLLLNERMCFRLNEYTFNFPVKGVW